MTKIKYDPADWTLAYDREHWFPFVEDENCNITGPGHQDKTAFALLINQYDEVASGEPVDDKDKVTADYIGHHWAVPTPSGDGEYRLQLADKGTEDAVAITTLWGYR